MSGIPSVNGLLVIPAPSGAPDFAGRLRDIVPQSLSLAIHFCPFFAMLDGSPDFASCCRSLDLLLLSGSEVRENFFFFTTPPVVVADFVVPRPPPICSTQTLLSSLHRDRSRRRFFPPLGARQPDIHPFSHPLTDLVADSPFRHAWMLIMFLPTLLILNPALSREELLDLLSHRHRVEDPSFRWFNQERR